MHALINNSSAEHTWNISLNNDLNSIITV